MSLLNYKLNINNIPFKKKKKNYNSFDKKITW